MSIKKAYVLLSISALSFLLGALFFLPFGMSSSFDAFRFDSVDTYGRLKFHLSKPYNSGRLREKFSAPASPWIKDRIKELAFRTGLNGLYKKR